MELSGAAQFDDWHRQACETLSAVYRENGYPFFYVGQAQKWLNMTLKYIFTLGAERITGFDDCYAFCHAPLDNVLIRQLGKYGFPPLATRWSRMTCTSNISHIRRGFAVIFKRVHLTLSLCYGWENRRSEFLTQYSVLSTRYYQKLIARKG